MPKYFHRRGRLTKTAHTNLQYKVVIYRNQKQQKILYKSRTIYPARKKYFKYLDDNKTHFPVMWDWLGKPVTYELLLLGNWGEQMDTYKAPSGVVYSVATKDGFLIKEINPYYIEEKFKYFNAKKLVTFKDVIKLMVKEKHTKTIIAFNNKLLVEIFEKDELHLFILKNKYDSERLYGAVKKFYYENHLGDCFFFVKPDRGADLLAFYDRIADRLGYPRQLLRRVATRS